MARLDNWQTNFSLYLEEKRNVSFDFALWNCLFFAVGAAETITGENPLQRYVGKFKTEKQAAILLRKLDNVSTSEQFLEKYYGEQKPVAFARIGDIVLVDPNETELDLCSDASLFGLVPGVCYGLNSYFLGENGLIDFPTLRLGSTIWVS